MNTQRQDEVIGQLGADDWGMVVDEYEGMPADIIEFELDGMFPEDDNAELAQTIYDELQGGEQ